ncbi:hypothetical protein D3C78_1180520 [compost metagenome]
MSVKACFMSGTASADTSRRVESWFCKGLTYKVLPYMNHWKRFSRPSLSRNAWGLSARIRPSTVPFTVPSMTSCTAKVLAKSPSTLVSGVLWAS